MYDTDQQQPTEQERVEDWREHMLVNAGYPPQAAVELSRRNDVDLHHAVELIRSGCDVLTAVDILI